MEMKEFDIEMMLEELASAENEIVAGMVDKVC